MRGTEYSWMGYQVLDPKKEMVERKRSALLVIKVKPGIRVKRTPMETERQCVFRRKRMAGRTREEEEEEEEEGGGGDGGGDGEGGERGGVGGERSAGNQ
ncbi:hypothetical protein HZH68_005768 [Vespula germanica]|uniref:Uncharacterized protein n=1 Tax=Vespula germanica TaxID=30212 RepID=A0A834NFT6_VESGE|nr:hypothetical protein HZH68_005768 [Vespula germanica]